MFIKKSLLRLVGCAATDETRYQLTGIFVERPETRDETTGKRRIHACATDGKVLAWGAHDEFDADTSAEANGWQVGHIVRTKDAKDLARDAKKQDHIQLTPPETRETDDWRIRAESGETVREIAPIEGTYPNYRLVTDDKYYNDANGARSVRINPFLMKRAMDTLCQSLKDAGWQENETVTMALPHEGPTGQVDRPIRVRADGSDGFLSVFVMPLVNY